MLPEVFFMTDTLVIVYVVPINLFKFDVMFGLLL